MVLLDCRESEGLFQFGNYSSEVEDLRSVIEYFTGVNRSTVAILGHSKGMPDIEIQVMLQ